MTVITIESDSEQKTNLLIEYAEKLGLPIKSDGHKVLTDDDVCLGLEKESDRN